MFSAWVQGVAAYSMVEFERDVFTVRGAISDCIITPIWEEAFFRYAPLTIIAAFSDKVRKPITLPIIILISVYFAEQHGAYIENILIQGVLSMLLSYIMLKKGFWYAVAIHALYNLSDYLI